MEIDSDIGRARIEVRRRDLRDRPPRRHADVLRQVGPVRTAVARIPDFAVVRARPDEAFLHVGRRNGEHELAVKLTQIVADDAAR